MKLETTLIINLVLLLVNIFKVKARTLVEIDEGTQISDDYSSNDVNYQAKRNLNPYNIRQFFGPSSYMQVPRPIYGGMFGGGPMNPFGGFNQMNQQPGNPWTFNSNQWSSNNQNDGNNNNVNNQPINNVPSIMSTAQINNQFINPVTSPAPSINNNPQAGASSTSSCIDAFRAKALERTNFYRQKHRVSGLQNNGYAENIAQNYAQTLNSQFTFQHNSQLRSLKLGENLYRKMQTQPFSQTPAACEKYAVEAIDSWYNEVSMYNFGSGGFSSSTGHFTQLVWKGTTGVGHGLSISSQQNPRDRFYYLTVVANYSPPGNMIGAFQSNVFAA